MQIPVYDLEVNEEEHNYLRVVREVEIGEAYLDLEEYNPEIYYKVINATFRIDKQSEEHLYMMTFNRECNPIGLFDVAHGTIDKANWRSLNLFTRILLCNAHYFIIAHNHPLADYDNVSDVNSQDEECTETVIKAALTLRKKCVDHLIIGKGCFFSLAKRTPIFIETEDDFYEACSEEEDGLEE